MATDQSISLNDSIDSQNNSQITQNIPDTSVKVEDLQPIDSTSSKRKRGRPRKETVTQPDPSKDLCQLNSSIDDYQVIRPQRKRKIHNYSDILHMDNLFNEIARPDCNGAGKRRSRGRPRKEVCSSQAEKEEVKSNVYELYVSKDMCQLNSEIDEDNDVGRSEVERKIPNDSEILHTDDLLNEIIEPDSNEAVKKRGRGRPPKEFRSHQVEKETDKSDVPKVKSKRGRPCIKSEVYNVDQSGLNDPISSEEAHTMPTEESKNATQCLNNDGPAFIPKESNSESKECGPKDEVQLPKSPRKQPTIKVVKTSVVECNSNVDDAIQPSSTDSEATDRGVVTSSTSTPSKYNWTGQTTVMVQRLFRGLQGKKLNEETISADPGQAKRRKGRPRTCQEFHVNSDGETTCMVCNEVVQNRDWLNHKQQLHYNLAWNKEDVPIDIWDYCVIQKAFSQLRKDQGFLKCNKCQLKLSSAKTFISHLEKCNNIVDPNGFVRCAVCNIHLKESEWVVHRYRKHNNLAWRVGDVPLNLEDQELVMRLLSALYKAKKPLYCELCDEQKKSVLGYLSHKGVCQLGGGGVDSAKIACEQCGKKVLPVSMDQHMKIHNQSNEKSTLAVCVESEFVNSRPRKAATRALRVMKGLTRETGSSSKYYSTECDFGEKFVVRALQKKLADCSDLPCIFTDCTFKSPQVEIMIHHLNSCDKKPEQYYVCKLCLLSVSVEEEIVEHLKSVHRKVSELDDEFDELQSEGTNSEDDDMYFEIKSQKKRIKSFTKAQLANRDFSRVVPLFLLHPIRENYSNLVYQQAYPWTLNFYDKFYAKANLFETFRNSTQWPLLDNDILDEYFPKAQESCDVSFISLNNAIPFKSTETVEFTKLDIFEVRRHSKDEATLFCGGPITTLAWLPTPHNESQHNQILAVAILNNWDTEYDVGQSYNEPCVLQFWNFGPLSSTQESDFEPQLLYGLAINSGPVWHLEWCPSGCLDKSGTEIISNPRLGLLAVATSDSFVNIYSVDQPKNEDDVGLIYKGEPVAKLQLNLDKAINERLYYATKISWTKAEGHRYVAVGYTTGVIAVFDLVNTSALLQRSDRNGVRHIFPYKVFQAHFTVITGLTLSHLDGGNHFCCSSSLDKWTTYWDLFKTTKVYQAQNHSAADSVWPIHWPMCLLGEDETTFSELQLAHTYVSFLRNSLTSTVKGAFTRSLSGINSVAFSDWLNLILHGGNAGEVMGQFAHRLYANLDRKKRNLSYVQCIFSTIQLIKKTSADNFVDNRFSFDEFSRYYGLALVDYNSDELKNIPNSKDKNLQEVSQGVEKYNISNYPLQAIRKVVANPNQQTYSFYATGLQAGFLRVRKMKFLENAFNPLSFSDTNFTENL